VIVNTRAEASETQKTDSMDRFEVNLSKYLPMHEKADISWI